MMNIKEHTDPFFYLEIENFLTAEDNLELYRLCKEQVSLNNLPSNELIETPASYGLDIDMSEVNSTKSNLVFSDIIQTKLNNITINNFNSSVGYWNYGIQAHTDVELYPHTDDPIQMFKDVKAGIRPPRGDEYSIIKGLIYIGNPDIEYKDYGTRIYTSESLNSEVTEIKFIPGNAIIFKCDDKSFHGTNFKSGFDEDRFTIGMEYIVPLKYLLNNLDN